MLICRITGSLVLLLLLVATGMAAPANPKPQFSAEPIFPLHHRRDYFEFWTIFLFPRTRGGSFRIKASFLQPFANEALCVWR